jgi:hypothetical protein
MQTGNRNGAGIRRGMREDSVLVGSSESEVGSERHLTAKPGRREVAQRLRRETLRPCVLAVKCLP